MPQQVQENRQNDADVVAKKRRVSKPRNETAVEDESITANRKMGQASRTLKACELCRKQKTRCFRAPEKPSSCLRCAFLNKTCSFENTPDGLSSSNSVMSVSGLLNSAGDEGNKLDMIYSGVSEVLALLKGTDILDQRGSHRGAGEIVDSTAVISPTNSFKASPFALMYNNSKVPRSISRLLNPHRTTPSVPQVEDIISLGIISQARVNELLDDFRRNYGRWVSFPSVIPTSLLVERVRGRSSLLLTTCCCISLRFSLHTRENQLLYRDLMNHLVKVLTKSLLNYSSFPDSRDGDIEFLQALVILSIYSLSLSSMVGQIRDEDLRGLDISSLNLDAWYLSSIGLTTCISKSTFGRLISNSSASDYSITILFDELNDDNQKLTVLRIYNHLCLVHIVNCVFSGRMCTIDQIRLNYCMATLDLPSATNFDGRMVSEITILWIAYTYVQSNLNNVKTLQDCVLGFEKVKAKLSGWYDHWEYLINQPAIQFVEFNFHVCSLVIYYNFNYFKMVLQEERGEGEAEDGKFQSMFEEDNIKSILKQCDADSIVHMVHHAYEAVKLVKSIESDSYFAYLSDQLHFCFYFCGVMAIHLCQWLNEPNQESLLEKVELADDFEEFQDTLAQAPKGVGSNPRKAAKLDTILNEALFLIDKFQLIGQDNEKDILTSYQVGLQSCLSEKFP